MINVESMIKYGNSGENCVRKKTTKTTKRFAMKRLGFLVYELVRSFPRLCLNHYGRTCPEAVRVQVHAFKAEIHYREMLFWQKVRLASRHQPSSSFTRGSPYNSAVASLSVCSCIVVTLLTNKLDFLFGWRVGVCNFEEVITSLNYCETNSSMIIFEASVYYPPLLASAWKRNRS